MKKVITVFCFFAFATIGFSQSQRLVLIEHFTQASCPPCAPANEAAEPILQANTDKVVAIKHQVSFPGYDPMNEHNPNEILSRRNYYNVRSVPSTTIDGDGPGSPYNLITQESIDAAAAIPAGFEINLTHKINKTFDGVDVQMEITATQASSGTYKAHIVVIEKEINYATAPGTNGEKDFYNVAKKFLPSVSGTNLPSDWEVGDKQTVNASWTFENVFDLEQIAVVAFVQDNRGLGVSQAAFSDANLQAAGPNDALVTKASAEGDFALDGICGNDAAPLIELMNAGTSILSSLDIYYSINGGQEHLYEWSGFLGYLKRIPVTLPAVKFEPRLDNYINIRVEKPNGETDDQTVNDAYVTRFKAASQTSVSSYIEARPGPLPSGVTWSVVDTEGNIVAEGGPYTTPFAKQKTEISLDPNECYKLIANNVSSSLNGYVRLYNDDDVELDELLLTERGEYRSDFGTYSLSNIDKVLSVNSLNVYPNPASTTSIVEFNMLEATQVNFVLTNTIGQIVWSETENVTAGNQMKEIKVNNIPNGVYFLQLQTDEGTATKQIAIQR